MNSKKNKISPSAALQYKNLSKVFTNKNKQCLSSGYEHHVIYYSCWLTYSALYFIYIIMLNRAEKLTQRKTKCTLLWFDCIAKSHFREMQLTDFYIAFSFVFPEKTKRTTSIELATRHGYTTPEDIKQHLWAHIYLNFSSSSPFFFTIESCSRIVYLCVLLLTLDFMLFEIEKERQKKGLLFIKLFHFFSLSRLFLQLLWFNDRLAESRPVSYIAVSKQCIHYKMLWNDSNSCFCSFILHIIVFTFFLLIFSLSFLTLRFYLHACGFMHLHSS